MIIQNDPPLEHGAWPSDWTDEPKSWTLYAITADRLNRGASAAILKGWQYARVESDGCIFVTRYLRAGTSLEVAQSSVTKRAQSAYKQIVTLAAPLPGESTPERAYEVRVLVIHELYLEVMWLHSLSGGQDVVIPYLSYLPELAEGGVYPFSKFLQVARREAAKLTLAPAV